MFQINGMSRVPVYEQIIEQTEKFIVNGILNVGERMPSVRNLSVTLGINPNTIQKAYTELGNRGIIFTVPGRGYFVSENAREIVCSKGRGKIEEFKALAAELAEYGMEKEELISQIQAVYKRFEWDDSMLDCSKDETMADKKTESAAEAKYQYIEEFDKVKRGVEFYD